MLKRCLHQSLLVSADPLSNLSERGRQTRRTKKVQLLVKLLAVSKKEITEGDLDKHINISVQSRLLRAGQSEDTV